MRQYKRLKGRPPKRAPSVLQQRQWLRLHLLLCANIVRSIPRAASLFAVSLVLCGRHVTGKGGTRKGKRYRQCEYRNERFLIETISLPN
jgi:hypothetical protein